MASILLTYYPCYSHAKQEAQYNDITGELYGVGFFPGIIDPTHACFGFGDTVHIGGGGELLVYQTPKQFLNPLIGLNPQCVNLFVKRDTGGVTFSSAATVATLTLTITPITGITFECAIIHTTDSTKNRGFQTSPVFTGLVSGTYMVIVRQKAVGSGDPLINSFSLVTVYGHISGSVVGTDTTSTGGSDGTATVNVSGGGGDYNITVNGVTQTVAYPSPALFSGLSKNTYPVVIIDNSTAEEVDTSVIINDPNVPLPQGTFFFVPPIQSLQFIHAADQSLSSYLQTLDNTLFCKRKETSPIWRKLNYFQKVQSNDKPKVIQWQSDYTSHIVALYNYDTDELVDDDILFSLKVQNIGSSELFDILIADNLTPGQSRVYFTGDITFPIPIAIGDTFNISSNAEGMNGNYNTIGIGFDTTLNQQYAVINKAYSGAGATSSAEGTFYTVLAPFNVYEAVIDFGTYPIGNYYMVIQATEGTLFGTPAISEPISVKATHPKTNLVDFYNIDNAFDINYTTGIKNQLRVESNNFQRDPAAVINTLRNTTGQSKMLRFLPQRKFLFQTYNLPPWMHEKLFVLFGMDYIAVQGQQVKAEEAYANPTYTDTFDLSSSSITIEVDWFATYNTHNLNPNSRQGKTFNVFGPEFGDEFGGE